MLGSIYVHFLMAIILKAAEIWSDVKEYILLQTECPGK